MGLPIWRDPEENRSSSRSAAQKPDPTASLRSPIRRHPYVPSRRSTRHSLRLPPRFERSPPPSSGFNGLREARRGEERGIPPISNLLEAADRDRIVLPSAPGENAQHENDDEDEEDEDGRAARRQLSRHIDAINQHGRSLRRNLVELRQQRARLRRERDHLLDDSTDSDVNSRHSLSPPANGDDSWGPMHTILLNPGEPLRIIRSPEPIPRRSRPHSRNGSNVRRNALPTPPLDRSGSDETMDALRSRPSIAHPLSNSWRPESPVDGLGDRNRSPTPADGWEIMRTTIAPDGTLPSAESSFASAAASESFNASSSSTQITEPDVISLNSRPNPDNQSDSASFVDSDELGCADMDEESSLEAFAHDMYMFEMETSAGRQRVANHECLRAQEGNRFTLATERVEIGFRLIEEALETEEGRLRLFRLQTNEVENIDQESAVAAVRMVQRLHERRERQDTTYLQRTVPGNDTVEAPREAMRVFHDFFDRFGAGAFTSSPMSPPPQYEPLNSYPDVNTLISRDRPEAHPVSPPSQRSEREVSEALLSGDIQDLDSMRRIVERLAARDDVPEEWWMSMGLNLSRTRPGDRNPRRTSGESRHAVLTGRIERGNSRL